MPDDLSRRPGGNDRTVGRGAGHLAPRGGAGGPGARRGAEAPAGIRHSGAAAVERSQGAGERAGQVLRVSRGSATNPRAWTARRRARDHFEGTQCRFLLQRTQRSEEHTSELQSLMRISYAVFCLKKTKQKTTLT